MNSYHVEIQEKYNCIFMNSSLTGKFVKIT